MKRKFAVSLIITLFMIALTFGVVSQFVTSPKVFNYIETILDEKIDKQYGFSAEIGKLDRRFLNQLNFKDIKLKYNGKDVVVISDIKISQGLKSVFKIVLGKSIGELNIKVSGIKILVEQDFFDYILSRFDDKKAEGKDNSGGEKNSKSSKTAAETSPSKATESANKTHKRRKPVTLSIQLLDLTVQTNTDKVILITSEKSSLSAKIETDFNHADLKRLKGKLPEIYALISNNENNYSLEAKGVDLDAKNKSLIDFSIESLKIESVNAENAADSTSSSDKNLSNSLSLSLQSIKTESTLNNSKIESKIQIGYTEFNFNQGLLYCNKLGISIGADTRDIESGLSVSASVEKIHTSIDTTDLFKVQTYKSLPRNNLSFNIDITNAGISANSNKEDLSINTLFYSDVISVDGIVNNKDTIVKSDFNSLITSLQLNNDYSGSLMLRSQAKANTDVNVISYISSELELSAYFNDIRKIADYKNIKEAALKIKNLKIDVLEGVNNIELNFNEGNVIDFEIQSEAGIQGGLRYEIDSGLSDIKLYFNRFKVKRLSTYFDVLPKRVMNMIDGKTELDGSFVVNGNIFPGNLNGKSSINLILNNLKIGSMYRAIGATLEAKAENNVVNIESLALSALGYRLSYAGSIDMNKYFPQGSLILQNSESGERLAYMGFVLDEDLSGYSIEGFLEKMKSSNVKAHIAWDKDSNIVSNAVINTKYGSYYLNVVFDHIENYLKVDSEGLEAIFNYDFDKKFIDGEISLKNFAIHISKGLLIHANAYFSGYFDMEQGLFLYSCKDFEFVLSDILSFGFNLELTERDFVLDGLYVNYRGTLMKFEGDAKIDYPAISKILSGETESFSVNIDFKRIDYSDYIKIVLASNKYSIRVLFSQDFPFELSLLGSRGNGFFATCRVRDVTFEARYKGMNVLFYNGRGNIGKLNLADFGFDINFTDRTLTGNVVLEHFTDGQQGRIKQGCTVGVSAKLDSIVLGALSLAGLDVSASFDLSVTSAYLGSDYRPEDLNMTIKVDKNEVVLEGNYINGKYVFKDKFVDLRINKKFLFGMHIMGSIGEEWDYYVEDLHIPVALLNQFASSPIYELSGGILEGRILIKGSSYAPYFYGTMYIQNLEMGLMYLPDQTLNAKNLVINVYEDKFQIKDVPIVGSGTKNGKYYNAIMNIEFNITELSFNNFLLHLELPDKPADLKLILGKGKIPTIVRGDVTGMMDFWYRGGESGLDADIRMDNTKITFKLDEADKKKPFALRSNLNIKLKTGRNVEIFYPAVDNAFMNLTIEENENISIRYLLKSNSILADSNVRIKSGRISYINNDFSILEGTVKFEKTDFQDDIMLNINLIANLKEYDIDGRQLDITMILRNATLDNIQPHFESIPAKSENEIINILGQSVLPATGENISIGTLANAATLATNAMASLGVINRNNNYRLGHVIRDALSLDVLSFRSPLVQNIIINSLPGMTSKNSLMAKYLNGTSLFAGKYVYKNLFARFTLILKQVKRNSYLYNYGHFLSDDLTINMELSLDFDNPIGSFSVFVQPQQLSILNFLDNIGFSVTKRIQF